MSHPTRRRIPVALGSAVALMACAGGPGAGSAGLSHMQVHYGQVGEIQTAVIAGNVEGTRNAARWLSTHEGTEFPPTAAAALEAMRNEGRIMLQQRDILPVARTLGRMGVACGSCHTTLSAGVTFAIDATPAMATDARTQMVRHAWAVDRMWEGLVAPSDASWNAGAGALATMPLNFGANDQANRLAQRLRDLSAQGLQATAPRERSDTYGDVLETCALCHATLQLRIR